MDADADDDKDKTQTKRCAVRVVWGRYEVRADPVPLNIFWYDLPWRLPTSIAAVLRPLPEWIVVSDVALFNPFFALAMALRQLALLANASLYVFPNPSTLFARSPDVRSHWENLTCVAEDFLGRCGCAWRVSVQVTVLHINSNGQTDNVCVWREKPEFNNARNKDRAYNIFLVRRSYCGTNRLPPCTSKSVRSVYAYAVVGSYNQQTQELKAVFKL